MFPSQLSTSRKVILLAILSLAAGSLLLFAVDARLTQVQSIGASSRIIRPPPFATISQYVTYDEQVGITFAQNYRSLSFNVTAVAQSDPSTGVGPAYLLNGLTNTGYWYQVGLSYRWPNQTGLPLAGFNMSYEVFTPAPCYSSSGCCSGSIFPTTCGAGIDNLTVNPGDTVQLSLSFSGANVTMKTTDWNTGSSDHESFSAEQASYFVGVPNQVADSNGFFSGLMTEQYFGTAYYGSGQPVHYRQIGSSVSAATMWADEFNTYPIPQSIFSDHTAASVTFNDTSLFKYFTSHGTAEASNSTELITGLVPITFPTISSSISSASYRPGQRASIGITITNPSRLTVQITSLKITTQFGTFDLTSSSPPNLTGDSTFTSRVLIPSATLNGTYTATVTVAFQFLDSQTPGWFEAQPIYSSSILTVAGPPISSTTLSQLVLTVGVILLPTILGLMAAGIVSAAVTLVVTRKQPETPANPSPSLRICSTCGGIAEHNMSFCPNCGASLSRVQSTNPSPVPDPSRQPGI